MGQQVSLFPRYKGENRTTNYCLLALRLLYDESPRFLAEALDRLIGDDVADYVGVQFRQQERRKVSIPDGLVLQKSIAIFIETKNFDWFYDEQLEDHLAALHAEAPEGGLKILIALGKFETNDESRFARIRSVCNEKYSGRVRFSNISFEDFVTELEKLKHLPKPLADMIAELRDYLDGENLLESWRDSLDVVNCAGFPEDIVDAHVYICPAKGSAYSHRKSRFFGMYRKKKVEKIAEIRAVVDVDSDDNGSLLWCNDQDVGRELCIEAVNAAKQRRGSERPIRVFLLGTPFDTSFEKDSPGGMMGSKQYFDVRKLRPSNAENLANQLKGKKWSEFLRET